MVKVKRGDTARRHFALRQRSGRPVPLDNAVEVRFHLKPRAAPGAPSLTTIICQIEDAAKGRVAFFPLTAFDVVGLYWFEFEVERTDGTVDSSPSDVAGGDLEVVPDLR